MAGGSLSEWGPCSAQDQWVQESLVGGDLSLEGLSLSRWEGSV